MHNLYELQLQPLLYYCTGFAVYRTTSINIALDKDLHTTHLLQHWEM